MRRAFAALIGVTPPLAIRMVLLWAVVRASAPFAAAAQVVEFSCGNVEFLLDTRAGTMTDRINGHRIVDWDHNGDWVVWSEPRQEPWGVSLGTGAFLGHGEVADDAGCLSDGPAALAAIPTRPGAALRIGFVTTPAAHRRDIQTFLAEVGAYDGAIDGRWGPQTYRGLLSFRTLISDVEFGPHSLETGMGASMLFDFLYDLMGY